MVGALNERLSTHGRKIGTLGVPDTLRLIYIRYTDSIVLTGARAGLSILVTIVNEHARHAAKWLPKSKINAKGRS